MEEISQNKNISIFIYSSNCFKAKLLSNLISGITNKVFKGHNRFIVTQLVIKY